MTDMSQGLRCSGSGDLRPWEPVWRAMRGGNEKSLSLSIIELTPSGLTAALPIDLSSQRGLMVSPFYFKRTKYFRDNLTLAIESVSSILARDNDFSLSQ